MMALLSHNYLWQKKKDDSEAYVKSCLMCQLDMMEQKKEARLLQSQPIVECPWVSIPMDFISRFPKTDGETSIMVLVDRFSKYGIFIAALLYVLLK